MALVWMESFDHEGSNANLLLKGYSQAGGGGSFVTGRFGNGWGNNRGLVLYRTIPTQTEYVIGFAFKLSSFVTGRAFLRFYDASGNLQGELRAGSSNTIIYARNGTTLATGSTSLITSTWYYIEWKLLVDNATGYSEVRINGDVEMTFTGDTQASANANIGQFGFDGEYSVFSDSGSVFSLDDIYVLDTTGSAPNDDFLGDVRVECLFPNDNGNSSQFLGSDSNSTDNYLLVDDTSPDGDTTYVEDDVVSDKDTYAYTDLEVTTGIVYGVQLVPMVRKTDTGARKFKPVTRLSATEVDGTEQTLGSTYLYFPEIQEEKPGGGAWLVADVNSAEFGVKVTT